MTQSLGKFGDVILYECVSYDGDIVCWGKLGILSDDHNHRHDIMEKISIFLLDKIKKYAIYIYI